MDQEKIKRVQHFKVIASEIVMVVAVILTVSILVLIVSGYWLNSDFKVERQGLLQISSIPTGADVDIDGDTSWLQRTNTSKTLFSGEHAITLSKEGYDTWSKTITIREGLLYRVHYPRLFLSQRETEVVTSVDDTIFATVSPDRNTLLLANKTMDWQIMFLNDEKIVPRKINVGKLFAASTTSEESNAKLFSGEILSADWAKDNAHVLFKIKESDRIEWIMLDIENVKDSINLSQKFDMDFDDVQIMNNSANTLVVLQGQSLRRIDVASEQISAI
ncbi:PEGA domain-containing protein, partial [Candidatus Saccharibacteria bacterium]|nr:PEGA domain-containing protein [Candidatus Saccharibacteria bacterium]